VNKEEIDNGFSMIQRNYIIINTFINNVQFTNKEKENIVKLWIKISEYKPYKEYIKIIENKSKELEKKKVTLWAREVEC
jgi:hypothetical protein